MHPIVLPCRRPLLLPRADSKLPHILLSAAFLAAPGAIAWGVDFLWRLYRKEAAEVTTLLPAWAGTALVGAGTGGSGSASQGQRPHDAMAAEARALAVLRASGQAEAEEQPGAGTAAAALAQQGQAGKLKPFVEMAYGERLLWFKGRWFWFVLCRDWQQAQTGLWRWHLRCSVTATGKPGLGMVLLACAFQTATCVFMCRIPATGVHRHFGLLPGQCI